MLNLMAFIKHVCQDKLDQALLQRPKREELIREGILGASRSSSYSCHVLPKLALQNPSLLPETCLS